MNQDLFAELSSKQKEIVMCTEGPVLVLAGAGSGKTRVLTHRIAHLVQNLGIPGYNILAITFTNKATKEMAERLENMLGPENLVWVHTFHKFCSIILRKHADKIGFKSSFSIYDDDDSKKIIRKILKNQKIDYLKEDEVKHEISNAKQKGYTPETYSSMVDGENNQKIGKLFDKYQEELLQANAMDYDDLLVNALELFKRDPEVAEYYKNKFRYIHVDEFQDTNKIQNDISNLIAEKWKNIFVVGDDDQCIYKWRGAEIDNILKFDKIYKDVKIFKLEENYRSTPNILLSANSLIKNNSERHEKELVAKRNSGVRVEYLNSYNDLQEAQQIASLIYSLKYNHNYQNSDFAILVREAIAGNAIENRIREAGINYRVLGGYKFYERKEILDVLAYLRLVSNPEDNAAFLRIINYPKRGMGEVALDFISGISNKKGIPLFEAACFSADSEELSFRAKSQTIAFVDLMRKLILKKNDRIEYLIRSILELTSFKEQLEKSHTKEEAETRYENVLFFMEQARQFGLKSKYSSLDAFIESVTLAPETKEIESEGCITISTVHAVKGLEFPVVFIVACEEGVFPARQSINHEEVEEERRVMYVAITRAKDRLYVSSARRRFRYGKEETNYPSRFISEMKSEEKRPAFSDFGGKNFEDERILSHDSGDDYGYNGSVEKANECINTIKQIIKTPNVYNESIEDYKTGKKIKHSRYGEGVIILISGEEDDRVATVEFPDLGIKKFVIKNTPMTLI